MTQEDWENILSRAGAVLNYGVELKEKAKNSKTAKLIAATPYLAGCNKAFETSFSHLILYLISLDESGKEIYYHKPEDNINVYARLFPISNFDGGNKEIIQCCMDLLSLCMVSNYNKDAEQDKMLGKYNPISNNEWDYTKISEKLIENIDKTITPDISEIYTKKDALTGIWRD